MSARHALSLTVLELEMNLQQVSHSEHNWTQRTTLSRVHSVQRHLLNRTLRLSDYLLKNTWR